MTSRIQLEAAQHLSQNTSRQLSAQGLVIQEDERKRIAADLHDVIGQSLCLIKLAIDNVVEMIGASALKDASDTLCDLSIKVKDTLEEVRRISMNLHPAMLDDLGILQTLSWFTREFESTCQSITVTKTIRVSESEIPSFLKIAIFRVLQEATTNVVKHSGADQIQISLVREDDILQLTVADNGHGFDPSLCSRSDGSGRGLGLQSIKERALISGGAYTIESAVKQGTRIRIAWPIGAEKVEKQMSGSHPENID